MKKVLSLLLVSCFALSVFAQSGQRTARLVKFDGDVKVKIDQKSEWQTPAEEAVFSQGAVIKTGAGAYAVISVDDGDKTATIDMEENSQMLFAELMGETSNDKKVQKTLLDLSLGKILVRAQKLRDPESKFEVKTPTSVVGIRGTVFSVQVEAAQE